MNATGTQRRATPELVKQLVSEVRQQLQAHRVGPLVLGVRAQAEWTHGDLNIDDATVRVRPCATPLAVREALTDFADATETGTETGPGAGRAAERPTSDGAAASPPSETLVILTQLSEQDLGDDILGRFVRPRLMYLNSWNAVCQRLGVRNLDPDFGRSELAWMADALLSVDRPKLPTAASTLSVETGLLILAKSAFGADTLTLEALLRATAHPAFADTVAQHDPALIARLCTTLGDRFSSAWPLVCGAIAEGNGVDALPAGLAAAAVRGADSRHYAYALVEAFTKCTNIEDAQLAAWAHAAHLALTNLENPANDAAAELAADPEGREQHINRLLTRGSQLVIDWRAPHPEASTDLAAGFEARLANLGRTLQRYLANNGDGSSADLVSIRSAVAEVRSHRFGERGEFRHRAVRAELAARLAIWLHDPVSSAGGTAVAAGPAGAVVPFGRVLKGYLDDGAWVDSARRRVEEGDDGPPELAEVLAQISNAAYQRRRSGNLRFAHSLAGWSEHGQAADIGDAPVIAVEAILDQIAVPLANDASALLIVLDGCGLPTFLELVGQFSGLGFEEIGKGPHRLAGLAALPTVTEVSRASLLCGALTIGDAGREKTGFAKHAGVSQLPKPEGSGESRAVLFHHHQDLKTGVSSGTAVRPEVQMALSGTGPRLVGVVINTIDDELSRGDFTRRYEITNLGPLQELLRAAANAGRYVIVTADHGHVLGVGLDGKGKPRRIGDGDGGGDRWRNAPSDTARLTLADDEVRLSGPRVLHGGEAGIIAPAQDDLRYSAKHGGYHGGATPEECLVPLSVFRPPGIKMPDGWNELSVAAPSWWDFASTEAVGPDAASASDAASHAAASRRPGGTRKRPDRRATQSGQGDLFSEALHETDADADQPAVATAVAAANAMANAAANVEPLPTPRRLPQAPWADELFASQTYKDQLKPLSRGNLKEADVRATLAAVYARGGTASFAAIADATGQPAVRIPGMVAMLERLLNIDGFGVFTTDRSAQEVRLDEGLLLTQFLDPRP